MRERLEDLVPIVDQLIDVMNTARKAFLHQRAQLLIQLNNQQDPLSRKIDSAIYKITEQMLVVTVRGCFGSGWSHIRI